MLHHESLTPSLRATLNKRAQFHARVNAAAARREIKIPVQVEIAQPIRDLPIKPYVVKRRFPSLDDVTSEVCCHCDVSLVDLLSGRKLQNIARARQVWMFLVRRLTPTSFPEMGRYLGGKDHTTCLHGWRKIEGLIQSDERLRAKVEAITIAIQRRFNDRNPADWFDSFDCCDEREI